jgi:hypothetical protein
MLVLDVQSQFGVVNEMAMEVESDELDTEGG